MKSYLDSTRVIARAATIPDLEALRTELAGILAAAGTIRDRQKQAADVRLCRWEGQSDDYRRHEEDLGEPAKPYEGAPDTRVPAVDVVINERVALLVEALMSGDIQAVPIGGLDQGEAALKMTRVLKWLRENVLAAELRREAELLGNYVFGDDPGVGILRVWWKREPALEMRELVLDEVGAELLRARGIMVPDQGPPPPAMQGAIDDVGDLLFNPARTDELLQTAQLAFPSVLPRRLRKALRILVRTGRTALPLPYVKENRPCVAALRYMQDVFFRPDIDDLQKATVIYEKERISETDLRSRVHSDGYREDWVEAVIEAGPGEDELDASGSHPPAFERVHPSTSGQGGDNESDRLYTIWHAYSRAHDDFGLPGVYWTVFSSRIDDDHGYHELLDYPHGEYPMIDFRSEVISRGIENARGISYTGGSFQYEIKVQRDCRGAHTQLVTLPPVRVAQRRGGLEAVLGPMVEVPVRQEGDVTWMTPPPFPNASIEMEKAARNDLDEYFGRLVPGVKSPVLSQALLQHITNRWLDRWKVAWRHIEEMQQVYGDPIETSLVTGGRPVKLTRDEIRGRFSTTLAFNVRDLNMDFVISRNEAINTILQQDVTGQVDRTVILRKGLRAIDPSLADESLRDEGAVTQREMEEETQAVSLMANGIEPPLRQTGINAGLRLQTMLQTVMKSPILARRFHQPANEDDELFKKLVETRSKNLQFLVQQYGPGAGDNPAIGRAGTAPALDQAQ